VLYHYVILHRAVFIFQGEKNEPKIPYFVFVRMVKREKKEIKVVEPEGAQGWIYAPLRCKLCYWSAHTHADRKPASPCLICV